MFCRIVPDTLRAHRDRLKWSQEQLAEKAGVNRQTVIKKENAGEPVSTNMHTAEKLARAMGLSVQDLCRPVQNEAFFLDIDVFSHLKICLNDGDHFHTGKLLDYITYNLAEALDQAQLGLVPDWQKISLAGQKPPLPSLPLTAISYFDKRISPDFEDLIMDFFDVWNKTFGGDSVLIEDLESSENSAEWHDAIRKLPVFERGRLKSSKFRALLYTCTKIKSDRYRLWLMPFSDLERWKLLNFSDD